MISATPDPPFASLAKRLAAKAHDLAAARAENRVREERRDPARWRKATLLWPLFARN